MIPPIFRLNCALSCAFIFTLVATLNDVTGQDINFEFISQQEDQPDTPPRRQPAPRRRANPFRRSSRRIASTPAPMGDLYVGTGHFVDTGMYFLRGGLPGGGTHIGKIAEHSTAAPVNRGFFHYNLFIGAGEQRRSATPTVPVTRVVPGSISRFTVGFERTIFDGNSSVELRAPMFGDFSRNEPDFATENGTYGNIAVIFKRLIYQNAVAAASLGVAIEAPTASDTHVRLPGRAVNFTTHSNATHISPFAALIYNPGGFFFYQAFLQLDVPMGGNNIDAVNTGTSATTRDVLTEQTLVYFDLVAGAWLITNRSGMVQDVAGLLELHTTTGMGSGDVVTLFGVPTLTSDVDFIANLTLGLQMNLANGMLARFGGVIPLTGLNNSGFHGEIIGSLIIPLQ